MKVYFLVASMHKCLALAFLIALAINFSSAATTMWPEYETTQVAAKKNWVVLEDAQPDELVKVTIGLHLRNTEVFTSMLLDVSDPRSKNYGKYKTQKEIYQLTSPSIESVSAVYDWLESANPISIEVRNNGGFISAIYPVSTARSLFSGDHSKIIFQKFYHKNNPTKTVVRCTSPVYIPQSLQSTIQLIEGVNDFPYLNIKSTKRTSHTSSSKWSIITGDGAAVVHVDVNTADYSQVAVTVAQGNVSQTQTQTLSASGLASIPFQFSSLANYVNLDVTVTQQDRQTGQITNIPTNYLFDVFPSPFITPAVANSLYFIPPGTKSTNISNSQAVAEFDEQYYSPSDLSSFSQLMGVPTPNVTVFGNNDPSKPGGESTLDIEWITAIGVGVPTYFWYVKEGFLLAWAISVSESPNPPLVHSISYGEPEALIKHSLLTRLNQEFQLLGTRGISIISTSGDLGSSDGTPDCAKDVPDFPSSSPWTTSLGATYISQTVATPVCTNNNVYGIPIVCDALSELPCAQDAGSGFTTGGGFSAKFARPSYQDAAVEAYINSAELPPSSYFNSSGRGFNDVGALGYHILAYQSGKLDITGGTSASGPIFAGILALLNDIQLNAGKPPLGFINPWLYQTADIYPQAFNPVLSGDNKCRESGQQCCENGFVAQRGWNPLTGLGTPVFPLLADALP